MTIQQLRKLTQSDWMSKEVYPGPQTKKEQFFNENLNKIKKQYLDLSIFKKHFPYSDT